VLATDARRAVNAAGKLVSLAERVVSKPTSAR
jgi:hypothetical protein